jgi:hypothetical protein
MRYYNKGITLYKEGVQIVTEPTDPYAGEKAHKKFLKALPYLKRSDSLCPGDTSVLTALTGIYYALNEKRSYARYKNALDSVKAVPEAKRLATTWIRLMFNGNHPDSLMKISGVPFNWDHDDVIVTKDSLLNAYKEVFRRKGKNRKYTIESVIVAPPQNNPGDLARTIPVEVILSLEGQSKPKAHYIFIRVSSKPEVAGFRD